MTTRKKIPIRVVQPELEEAPPSPVLPVEEAPPLVAEAPPPTPPTTAAPSARSAGSQPTLSSEEELALREELEQWKDRALRLEAEMDNFRKRLQRLADERIAADRERLLRAFLEVADDLARALSVDGADAESIRQGVELTHRSLMNLMSREGVTPIEANGQPFDPAWHEAVGTVPAQQVGQEPDTVVHVVRPGYRIGDRLLRPARVIVATANSSS
ncbi:MAG: nucleotide exchange factor GrpE [Anaerolineae bacterium]|nr:nucleotide exchange factor GrpE [Anaerolineae bacterium]MDW8068327.1 nucleotide exchange factor GrpE [Anaerolineae bacterium]